MRLIVLFITLFVVAVLVGFLAYQQTDQYNLVGLTRWVSISFILFFVLSGVFLAFVVIKITLLSLLISKKSSLVFLMLPPLTGSTPFLLLILILENNWS